MHVVHLSLREDDSGHQAHSTPLVILITRSLVIGLVPEPVKLAFSNRFRILLVLARLYWVGGLLDFLLHFLFLFLFVLLLSRLFSLQRSTRSAVLGTWDGDAFGFERLFNLGQLLDEDGELIDVERDALERIED